MVRLPRSDFCLEAAEACGETAEACDETVETLCEIDEVCDDIAADEDLGVVETRRKFDGSGVGLTEPLDEETEEPLCDDAEEPLCGLAE